MKLKSCCKSDIIKQFKNRDLFGDPDFDPDNPTPSMKVQRVRPKKRKEVKRDVVPDEV